MSRTRSLERAVKLVDADQTEPDPPAATANIANVTSDADTDILPRLRPEVLRDAAQRHTKAAVHAALFKGSDEAPTIGAYRVLTRIGEGGMGIVYAAYDEQLARKVALKLIRGAAMQRPEGRARILREARALARVSHPNVVHVYQVGEVDDEIFVAMEFLTGPTLRAWSEAQPRTWREVLAVMRQAGEGLAAAHRQGVVHRDFKPANVIVGDDGRVRVLDFGLAHFGEPGEAIPALPATAAPTDLLLTQTGAVLGTPAYMAAEQFAGARGDTKTDQFSFCTALYEALHGERPFTGDDLTSLALAVSQGHMQPLKTDAVPMWLHRVVLRGLQRDPSARWPSMDALLAALQPPQTRPWRRTAAALAASSTVLLGGVYMLQTTTDAPELAAEREASALARNEATRAHDEQLLIEARAALTRDPTQTIRALAQLTSDDPTTWQRARFLTTAAQARGIPEQVLRAGDRPLAEVRPTADGFLGRDDLGAVWRWKLSEKTATPVLSAGAANQLLVARDVPVWAALADNSVAVFTADATYKIALGAIEPGAYAWRLTPDGRTLVATLRYQSTGELRDGVHLWDLTRPDAPPRTIELLAKPDPVVSADASLVLASAGEQGIRTIDPRTNKETLLPYPDGALHLSLSTDGRFAVVNPATTDHVLDVIELATGKTRRVEADTVVMLAGADALFTRRDDSQLGIRRESLATGAHEWRTSVPPQSWSLEQKLLADPTGAHFAVALGEQWAVGDLRSGTLTSFLTVPKDIYPQWAGPGALLLVIGDEARIHRPAASPVQVRHQALRCDLASGGRWAVLTPWDVERGGEYTRVDLTDNTTSTFRCPSAPPTPKPNHDVVWSTIDDSGQVAILGNDGWNCWWDPQHGARLGAPLPAQERLTRLPQGIALATGTEVQVWPGPDAPTQRFTIAAPLTTPVSELLTSPTGAHLAARSDHGLQLLHRDTGMVTSLTSDPTPLTKLALQAQALAWSPDATRLALLRKPADTLELIVWDVTGEPREISRHDLKDSPGRPGNLLAFTPSGTALALTDRLRSLTLVNVAGGPTHQLEAPDLSVLVMRSETELAGIELRSGPLAADFATSEVAPLAPPSHSGWTSRPPMRRSESGSAWACDAVGMGTLLEISPIDTTPPADLRARIHALAAAL